jgi:excisionase family DNA binding protein
MPRGHSLYNPVVPSPATVKFAQDLLHVLKGPRPRFALIDHESGKTTEIDETVYRLFQQLLIDLAQSRAVSILPVAHELTTHQAAEMLNVSRPFLVRLLEKGEIPFRRVGTHRRITLEALLAYKEKQQAKTENALDELAKEAQELKIY